MKTTKPPEVPPSKRSNPGSDHEELVGASFPHLYRLPRYTSGALGGELVCVLRKHGRTHGPFPIIDVSDEGLAFAHAGAISLESEQDLEKVEIRDAKGLLWEGIGRCAYWREDRVGLHFTDGTFDLAELKARTALRTAQLNEAIERWTERNARLPADWRAGVAEFAGLFNVAQDFLTALEQDDLVNAPPNSKADIAAIEELYRIWWPECESLFETLHAKSKQLDPELIKQAREFSSGLLAPLVYGSAILGRAIDKPLGYAGDYVQMTLYEQEGNGGATLYDRFVDHISKNSSVGSAVVARQSNMIEAIKRCIAKDKPVRIVSLASGPASEICKLIRATESLEHPVEFILIDQDADALAFAKEQLRKALAEKSSSKFRVKVTCVHIAIKQMLRPGFAEHAAHLKRVLGGADLVYSAGLFDYLRDSFASTLLFLMFTLLTPGGELFIGNARDTAQMWMLDYVVSWHLIFREKEDFLRLVAPLTDHASAIGVEVDATGTCLFLRMQKK
jgi:hypothetical protein